MDLTPAEALELLQTLGLNLQESRAAAERCEAARDAVVRALDGQPGVRRSGMAAALGVTPNNVHRIVSRAKPEREQLADGVPMDPELYAALVAVIGGFARQVRGSDAVRLHVSPERASA